MQEAVLARLGLTAGEIKVYFALNRLGESTVGAIGRKSGVSKSKIYEILDRLIAKGLAGYIVKGGTKHFSASDPHMILEFLDRREEDLRAIRSDFSTTMLPTLLAQRASAADKRLAELYEGLQGIKGIREELMGSLRAGEDLLVLGAPKLANEKWEGWFLEFHALRVKRGVRLRILYNADAQQYGAIRTKMALTQVRYLPDELVSPNWIDIFPQAVLFVMLTQVPLAFVVRDSDLAASFRAYFDLLWNGAKR